MDQIGPHENCFKRLNFLASSCCQTQPDMEYIGGGDGDGHHQTPAGFFRLSVGTGCFSQNPRVCLYPQNCLLPLSAKRKRNPEQKRWGWPRDPAHLHGFQSLDTIFRQKNLLDKVEVDLDTKTYTFETLESHQRGFTKTEKNMRVFRS